MLRVELLWMLWTELDGHLLACHEPFPDRQLVVSPSRTGEKPKQYIKWRENILLRKSHDTHAKSRDQRVLLPSPPSPEQAAEPALGRPSRLRCLRSHRLLQS